MFFINPFPPFGWISLLDFPSIFKGSRKNRIPGYLTNGVFYYLYYKNRGIHWGTGILLRENPADNSNQIFQE